MAETILIVDDEESVRRTIRDWLTQTNWDITVVAMGDSEEALRYAQDHPIDLAILDWNLGTGIDGLQLLEDLVQFRPEVVAIMVTGFAHQATPLHALRMGVRDYFDKDKDFNRDVFLTAVRKQLDRIIPAKNHRRFMDGLLQFRESVSQILPLVGNAAAMNEPVTLPDMVKELFRFLVRLTGATDGAMIGRIVNPDGTERLLAYAPDGQSLPTLAIPFSRSLAATLFSMQEPCLLLAEDLLSLGPVDLQPFEQQRQMLLAVPIPVADHVQVVIELFDKPSGFTSEDRQHLAGTATFCTELLRQALAQRQTQELLISAVQAALTASQSATAMSHESTNLPKTVMEQITTGLNASANRLTDGETSLELIEAIRELAMKHGPQAVRHCKRIINNVHELLDETVGEWNQP